MRRIATCACTLASVFGLAGCTLTSREPVIDGAWLANALEVQLGVQVEEVPQAPMAGNLHNVRAVYSARSVNERLLAVVFDSAAATVQVLGVQGGGNRVPGLGRLFRHNNVVVIYQHDAGTVSRWNLVRTVVDAAPEV